MSNSILQTIENNAKEFDKHFTVLGQGKVFFDIVDKRTESYIHAHQPTPKEHKHFLLQSNIKLLEAVREEYIRGEDLDILLSSIINSYISKE